MAPVTQLGVLAFATAVLAVPHAQWKPLKRHAHAHASAPAYGTPSSSAPVAPVSSDPVWSGSAPAYPSASSADPVSGSSWSAPGYPSAAGSSYSYYPSGSSVAPVSSSTVPSAFPTPTCWTDCFNKAGITSEDDLCGNTEVNACIYDTCCAEDDKAYWTWYESFCPAPSSSVPVSPVSSSAYSVSYSASATPTPTCWTDCFTEAQITSEDELCGNTQVDQCIYTNCSPAEDKAYWAWYESFCPTPSGSASYDPGYGYPSSSYAVSSYAAPTGGYSGYPSGAPSYSTCTETSTLIYRSTTQYSTYYITHTVYESPSATPVSPASDGGAWGSAPGYTAPASAPAYGAPSGSPVGAVGGDYDPTCAPDVTVTETLKTTVYVTYGGAPTGGAPSYGASSYVVPAQSSEAAAPSYPAGGSSWGAPAPSSVDPAPSSYAAPSYPAGASSSAPAPTYSAPPSSGGFGKRGLAYNDASLANALGGTAAGGWAYNWISNPGDLDSSIPYFPALHDTSDTFTSVWQADASAAIANGAEYLFSFNEPDMSTQAALSPEDAAAAWKQYMEPFAGQAKLVAPAVTNSQSDGMGLNWLQSFFDACSDCTIDAVAQHWYFPSNDVDNFKDQITRAAAIGGGKGVFLNEFGAVGSDEDKSAFLTEVLPWLDGNASVLGYSYFMVSDGLLMTGDSPSAYGETYCA